MARVISGLNKAEVLTIGLMGSLLGAALFYPQLNTTAHAADLSLTPDIKQTQKADVAPFTSTRQLLSVNRQKPVTQNIVHVATVNSAQSLYKVQLKLATNRQVAGVAFPIWTAKNGADDCYNYPATFNAATGNWEATVKVSDHNYNGSTLVAKATLTMKNGDTTPLETATTFTVPSANLMQIIDHRGNHSVAPENSLPAFAATTDFGAETDIQLTSDKQWVVMHDSTLDRTSLATGVVNKLTAYQVDNTELVNTKAKVSYDYDELTVPTFEKYLATCRTYDVTPIIEIKQKTMASSDYDSLIALLAKYEITTDCYVISFYGDHLKELARRNPEIPMMYLTENKITSTMISDAQQMGNHAGIDSDHRYLTQSVVDKLHAANLKVGVWTLIDSQISKYQKMGVDLLTVDRS